MTRRITWLVAATSSAIVLAFVIPLCLLVRTLAEDRALASANDEARSVATLVSGLSEDPTLAQLVAQTDQRSAASTSVLMPDGAVLGTPRSDLASEVDGAEASTGEAFTRRTDDGLEIVVPVITAQGTSVVRTLVSNELLRSGVRTAWASIIGLGLLLMGLALFVASRLGRRVTVPVTELADVAQRLQDGDLRARADPQGPEETVHLAETVNRLAERIGELLTAERAAVGDLSHRLRTPVTALRLDAETVPDGELAARLQLHIEQLQRTIDAVVRDARRPLHEQLTSGCDLTSVVTARVAFWTALAEDQGRPVEVDLLTLSKHVSLEASEVTDLVDVLVDNVFAHTPDDAAVAISLRVDGATAALEVRDSGPGMSPAPTSDRPGSTGLGLDIARRIAARAGGRLEVRPATPGVVARVELPVTG